MEISLCGGHGSLTGSVHGLVYAAKRESFGRALAELKVGAGELFGVIIARQGTGEAQGGVGREANLSVFCVDILGPTRP